MTERHEYEEQSSPSRRSKCQSFFCFSFAFLLGSMAGFAGFYQVFYPEFSNTLQELESRHKASLINLNDRLEIALEEKQACLNDDSTRLQLAELQGKVSGQVDLAVQHESLIQEYNQLIDEIETLENSHRQLRQEKRHADDELREHRFHVDKLTEEKNELARQVERREENAARVAKELGELRQARGNLEAQVQSMTSEMQLAEDHAERMKNELRSVHTMVSDCEGRQGTMHGKIRQRHMFLCKAEYGNGPYYVQLVIHSQQHTNSMSFVVEIASRKHMPHNVWTFLSLIEYQLFDGLVLDSVGAHGLLVTDVLEETRDEFFQKLNTLGVGEHPLMFPEIAPQFPCEEHTIGFRGLGPFLEIYNEGNPEKKTCFGKIVRGEEHIDTLQELISRGERVELQQVQQLDV
eukprot:Nitzschia sp. Nitz4//scaffold32_size149145//2870//4178//NITZ4_002859-RA/size149145-augustus-gene-0.45-mRNA-1//-1//CDS//3329548009//8313//frame0